jgi:hypothetical protein
VSKVKQRAAEQGQLSFTFSPIWLVVRNHWNPDDYHVQDEAGFPMPGTPPFMSKNEAEARAAQGNNIGERVNS